VFRLNYLSIQEERGKGKRSRTSRSGVFDLSSKNEAPIFQKKTVEKLGQGSVQISSKKKKGDFVSRKRGREKKNSAEESCQ